MNTRTGIGDYLLIALEKATDGFVRLEDFLANTHIYAKGYERPLKKSSFSKAIKRLREKGFIEFANESEIIIKLTDAGKTEALWEKVRQLEGVWDGKWRIVAFDIPESHSLTRNLFRRRLKELGFQLLQKSIWISKANCTDLIRKYINDLGISKWVSVLEAENVDFGELNRH
ncbi:MAG: repressor in ring oxydation complex/phenylacetic acid degradation pathway related protein (PaaX) [uncultured bacterium]|nr:MAG: repressor in ring oxydation complex/phenylacetic acid degradation pathway related protein (PaaX) [uncultured bacterium]HLC88239.1 hypothetical protein [Patescibacteria group bacterium]